MVRRNMFKLIKNTHTAAIHLPPARRMPEVTLLPGVTPVSEGRWFAALENATVEMWVEAGKLVDVTDEIHEAPTEDDKSEGGEEREAEGQLQVIKLPPLPTLPKGEQ